MRAAYASSINPDDPARRAHRGRGPGAGPAWPTTGSRVEVRASSLNHHDLWSLRGVGLPADRLPMILGCDAAGVDEDGNEVVLSTRCWPTRPIPAATRCSPSPTRARSPTGWPSPARTSCPSRAGVPFTDAACLPTAWLTAYHMLTAKGRVAEADAVLVQGAGGGVATAAVVLAVGARQAGLRDQPRSRQAGAHRRARRDRAGARGPAARAGPAWSSRPSARPPSTTRSSAPRRAPGSSSPAPPPAIWPLWTFAGSSRCSWRFSARPWVRPRSWPRWSTSAPADSGRSWTRSFRFPTYGTAFEKLYRGDVFGKIVLDHTR